VKESTEKIITLGFTRRPREVFDEIDQVSAGMIREGWRLADTCVEEGLGKIHLFFEREIDMAGEGGRE
jgi:hypothetical protein